MSTWPRPELLALPFCPHGSLPPGEGILDFSLSVNPYGPPPGLAEALTGADLTRYPDPHGEEARSLLARATGLPRERLIAGNGSTELLWLLGMATLRPGDRVLVAGPTFGEYARMARVFGAEVLEERAREEDAFRPDLKALAERVERERPRLVFLCNPNNPTGVYLEPARLLALAHASPSSLLVVDQAYLPFVEGGEGGEGLVDTGRVFLLRSLTKAYGVPGLRLGYGVGPPEVVEAMERARPPWSLGTPALAALAHLLSCGDFLAETLPRVREARDRLREALEAMGFPVLPSAANFLPVRVGDGPSVREALIRRGVAVRDCSSFGLRHYIRIGVRRPEENQRLLEALEEAMGSPGPDGATP